MSDQLMQREIRSAVEYSGGSIHRSSIQRDTYSVLVDEHDKSGVRYHYYFIRNLQQSKSIPVGDNYRIIETLKPERGNELLIVRHNNGGEFILMTGKPYSLRLDESERIVQSSRTVINYTYRDEAGLEIEMHTDSEPVGSGTISVMLIPRENIRSIEEIQPTHRAEMMSFRKSNWFVANGPDDIWNYLINGSIYDPRAHPSIGKQFKCQQCAFAWWEYFGYLSRCTGKNIYGIIQDEIAFSIVCDMDDEGAWRHGFWSDDMEIHSRFQLDGINLLISQYEKDRDEFWLEKAHTAMDFVIHNLTDTFQNGDVWFLHDSIEEEDSHKFYSTLFGKNEFNTLCLNTHIQALCVLRRLTSYGDSGNSYEDYYKAGKHALFTVMDHKPAERLYKLLVKLFLVQKNRTKGITIFNRIKKAAAARLIGLFYWKIREKYPRIVLPGGLIERDLNITKLSDRYHIINIKDLLSLYKIDRDDRLIPYIKEGLKFVEKLLDNTSLDNLLKYSPYYVEYLDILRLYSDLIEPVSDAHIEQIENTIIETIGGTSLDHTVSFSNEGQTVLRQRSGF
jgi:hypothetical protein